MTPTPHSSHGLSLSASNQARLSPMQKRFNKLLGELEGLRRRFANRSKELEKGLADYARLLADVEREEDEARRKVMLKLGEFWRQNTLLKKGQRPVLRELLLRQSQALRNLMNSPEEGPLVELIRELVEDRNQPTSLREADPDTLQDLATELLNRDLLDPAFLEQVDTSQFSDDMSPEDLLKEYQRQAENVKAGRAPDGSERKQSKKQEAEAKREALKAEVRERTLGTLYKQLAKVLHPDLERDPQRQAEKLRLMQQVTEAYRNKDLFTLLRLEIEHLQKDEKDTLSLTEEKLRIYVDVLKEQVELLRADCEDLPCEPRFACITDYVLQASPRMPDWKILADQARLRRDGLRQSLQDFEGKPAVARKELREALAAFEETERRRRFL